MIRISTTNACKSPTPARGMWRPASPHSWPGRREANQVASAPSTAPRAARLCIRGVVPRELARRGHPQSYGRVDVRARNVTYRGHHGYQGQPEGQRDGQRVVGWTGSGACQDGADLAAVPPKTRIKVPTSSAMAAPTRWEASIWLPYRPPRPADLAPSPQAPPWCLGGRPGGLCPEMRAPHDAHPHAARRREIHLSGPTRPRGETPPLFLSIRIHSFAPLGARVAP